MLQKITSLVSFGYVEGISSFAYVSVVCKSVSAEIASTGHNYWFVAGC